VSKVNKLQKKDKEIIEVKLLRNSNNLSIHTYIFWWKIDLRE